MRGKMLSAFLTFALCCSLVPAVFAAPTEVIAFAAASMTETLNQIAELYKKSDPSVKLVFNFDSSGTLKTQIQEGADCDVFISAAQKQMNQLDIESDQNPDGLDFVAPGTRFNLLENKVVLIVPKENPAGVKSFEDIGSESVKLIALGNDDVPVGQYSREILTNMGIWDSIQSRVTFGSNVKEVTTQVAEGAVDCGIVYATDAHSAGLEVVAEAPAEALKTPVVYPAAVMKSSKNPKAAQSFLSYLKGSDCTAIFKSVGFSKP
ncbi:MAG: molybdate ABC transporter substrate-binding protein [Fretibacterium sp.]|nr:molybdate ABC transporter substrate-binding protein [Fretibacterium sp.]